MEAKELITYEETTALAAFTSDDGLDPYIRQAKDIVSEFDHDLSTASGRKKTASLAAKVAKLKVKLDDLGKDLVSDWKTKAKAVDSNRKSMRDALDELKIEARKPLTDWEDEQARIEAEEAAKAEVEKMRLQVESDHEIAILLDEKITREKMEAELVIERDRIQREDEMKRQAAETARIQAEEKAREEKEQIERQRIQAEERAKESERQRITAEERLKMEAVQAEQRRIAAEEQATIDAELAAESAKQAQIQAQKDKEAAELEELEKRESNNRHVGAIRKAAKEALMSNCGLDEKTAKAIVLAINSGSIANVTINY